MSKVAKISEFLENELNDCELVEVWNNYCDRNNMCDDNIFPLTEADFDDYFKYFDPHEIAQQIYNAVHYHPCDTWFTYDGYGRLRTFNFLDGEIDTQAVAEYAFANNYCFGIWEIADILEEDES